MMPFEGRTAVPRSHKRGRVISLETPAEDVNADFVGADYDSEDDKMGRGWAKSGALDTAYGLCRARHLGGLVRTTGGEHSAVGKGRGAHSESVLVLVTCRAHSLGIYRLQQKIRPARMRTLHKK